MICLSIDSRCPEITCSVGKCTRPIKQLTELCCVRGGMGSGGDDIQIKHMNTINKESLWFVHALMVLLEP